MKTLFLFILLAMNMPQCMAQKFSFDGITMMQPFENFADSLKAKGYDIWPDETCFLGSGKFLGKNTQLLLVNVDEKSNIYYADEITVGYSFKTRQEAIAFMKSAIKQLENMYPRFNSVAEKDGGRFLEGAEGNIRIFMDEKTNMSNSIMLYPNEHGYVVAIYFEADSSDEPLINEDKKKRYNNNEDKKNLCGEKLSWTYNETTKTLTISGNGEMYEYYEASQTPWYDIHSDIQNLIISPGVKTIGDLAFWDFTGLTTITIPNSVTSIGESAFKDCRALASVGLGTSVTSIGSSAFSGCIVLESLTIPNSVKSIGQDAFQYCFSLKSLTIGKGVTSIGGHAFSSLNLAHINVDKNNKTYDSRNNCNAIIETNSNTLLLGCKNTHIPNNIFRIGDAAFESCRGLKVITIPNSVNSICELAFWNCQDLESVIIPNNVTTISYRTFCLCTNLKHVTIPNSVFRIAKEAFYFCKSLNSIHIPNSVVSIDAGAFNGCDSLTSVTFPRSVIGIGANAFEGCSRLKDIHCKWKDPTYIRPNTFDFSIYSSSTLFVPRGTKDAYQTDTDWSMFDNIEEE